MDRRVDAVRSRPLGSRGSSDVAHHFETLLQDCCQTEGMAVEFDLCTEPGPLQQLALSLLDDIENLREKALG